MRRSLLNKRILPKPLRQALVLITLLLLPSAAWGEEEIKTTFTGYNNSSITFNDNSYMWEIVENQNATFETYEYNNEEYSLKISPSTDGAQITVMLKSKFTVSGTLSTNDLLSTLAMGSVETVGTSNGNFKFLYGTSTSPTELLSTQSVTWPIENIELSANNFSNDIELSKSHIYIEISGFTKAIYLKSITLSNKLTESFDIKVAGIVPEENGDITGASSTGTVTYDATTRTLTLNNATIDGDIIKSSSADDKTLIIKLEESNSLTGSIAFNSQLGDLTFTGDGSLAISSEEGVLSGIKEFNASGFYLATDHPLPFINEYGYYLCAVPDASGTDRSVKQLTVSKDLEVYPIWVHNETGTGYTQVTKDNKDNVLSNNHIAYNNETPTLTLSDYTLTTTGGSQSLYAFYIGKDLKNMTVNLVGNSTIGDNDNGGSGFAFEELSEQEEKASLTFTTSKTSPGSLTVGSELTDGSVTVNYSNGLGYTISTKKVSTDWTRLVIGTTPITESTTSVEGYENVSFDDENNILTLSGATIGSSQTTGTDIFVYMKDLTVEISGTNTINGRFWGQYEKDRVKGTILFKKVSNAQGNPSLTISGNVGASGPIYEFSNCTWDKDLYLTEAKDESGNVVPATYFENGSFKNDNNIVIKTITISTTKPSESIWIGGEEVNDDGTFDITFQNGSVIFDKENNILTLNQVTFPQIENLNIVSNLPNLTIKLANGASAMYSNFIISSNPTATLTFITDDNSDLYFYTGTDLPWKGFADNPTFKNQLVFLKDGDSEFIRVLSAPGMSYSDSDSKLTLSDLGYSNSQFSYYYAITYADNEGNIPKTKKTLICQEGYQPTYSDDITITHTPFTVEASVIFEDQFGNITESETTIGKYFGIADKTIVFNNETKGSMLTTDDLEISPVTEGVTFTIVNAYNSSVISYDAENGATIVGIGACNIGVKIDVDEGSNIQILNTPTLNPDSPGAQTAYIITKEVTVLPDKPSIVKDAEHEYIETDKITITRTSIEGEVAENIKIFYIWSDDEVEVKTYQPYVDGGSVSIYSEPIAAQTGTLRAWVGYHAGDNYYYNSEVVSEEFTVYEIAEMEWESETQTYGTFYNPDKDMAVPTGSTAYIVTGISEDGTSVTISPVSYIKAGVAVLIERNKTTEVSKTTDFSASKMNYSNPNTPAQPSATDNWYVIYNNKFVKVTEGTQVKGGKCYLNLNSTPAGTRGFYNIGDGEGTTAIREVIYEGVNSEKLADGAWHDLQGRKFTTKPTKAGIYIRNGKKIVIK